MLTTIYLILSICNGSQCDFKGLEEFTGSENNAIVACQIARQGYPTSDDIQCYYKSEDDGGIYFDSVNGEYEILIEK